MKIIIRWIKRTLATLTLVVIVIFFAGGTIKGATTPDAAPTTLQAPWMVQTSSRVYYAKDFSIQAGSPSIRDYWTFDGKRYHYTVGVMPFPKKLFGDVKVYQR